VARRGRPLLLAVAATVLLAVPVATAPASTDADLALERSVLAELNAVRRAHGLPALRPSPALRRAAGGHSSAMTTYGFFAHASRDGTPFWKRIRRSYPATGFRTWSVGETLLYSTPGIDGASAVRMWLRSPAHRRVLLHPSWRDAGISAVTVAAAPGDFAGLNVTVVTADFGIRR
jgi:uncharacterized protein YkwD